MLTHVRASQQLQHPRRRVLRASLSLLLVLLLLLGAWPAQAAPPTPGARVQPATGSVGTTFTFQAAPGWLPNEELEYWVIGPGATAPFERGSFPNLPDAEGRTTWTWTAPEGIWSGTWTMNARGSESYAAVQVPFTLTVGEQPFHTYTVEPASGTIGTKFTFRFNGWPEGDVIDSWVLPPGRIEPFFLGRFYGDPDEAGFTEWSWEVPPDAWGGVWTMNARGDFSEAAVTIPFYIDGPPAPPPAAASAIPAVASPGTRMTFIANGYDPGEEIAYWIDAPGETYPIARNGIDELFADIDGVVSWEWTVPSDAPLGTWSTTARGVKTGFQHQILFEVVADAPDAAPAPPPDDEDAESPTVPTEAGTPTEGSVQPLNAPAGTIFHFEASGFKRKEQIQYWLTDPEGETTSDNQGIFADEEGHAVIDWPSPPDALGGQWTMTMLGSRTRVEVQVQFVIDGPGSGPPPQQVSPPVGSPGTIFSFSTAGLFPREKVGWWITAPDGAIYQGGVDVKADAEGRFSWEWVAPAAAPAGNWMAVLQGKRSDIERMIPFELVRDDAPPAATLETGVTPDSGPPGTVFTFTAIDLEPEESVSYWATAPDGTIYATPPEDTLRVNEEGVVSWSWTAPEDAMPGRWTMVIQSNYTDDVVARTLVEIPFTIE
jgi:hypothetical protein